MGKTKGKTKSKAKGTMPTKNFQKMYNKMIPSKENRRTIQLNSVTSPYLIAGANIVNYLTTLSQGTNMDQRMRNAVYFSGVKIHGTLQQTNTASVKSQSLRLMIFREVNFGDLNPATLANLFKSNVWADQPPDGKANVGRWTINRDRYQIFYDQRFLLPPPDTDRGIVTINKYVKLGKVVYYPQTDSTNTEPIGGRICVVSCLYNADDVLSTDQVHIELQFRAFFKDYNKPYKKRNIS